MNFYKWNCFKNSYNFGATVLRLAFAIFFILAAVAKFRMGFDGFAESIVNPLIPNLISQEIPDFILYIYGYVLPVAEFIAGVLLLVNKYTREAYITIALIFLSFIFISVYNGNTSIVGREFFPAIIALLIAFLCEEKK